MKKKHIFLIIVCVLLYTTPILAQSSIVNVSPLTGAASVVIPVYSFTRGQVTFPVSLVNAGNGIRVKDIEGTAGIGWNVQAGGQVSRVLRGLPDDCLQDASGNSRLGWMSTSNTAPGYISNFQDNAGNCAYETADLGYISSHFPVTMDSEPDMFYVNAPGLSCQLVYDRSLPGFRPISYQDLRITYTTTSGEITSFTIINDKGVKYVFATPERGTITTALNLSTDPAPSYFTTKYLQYQFGISYYDNWHLTSVTDANGNGISLTYTTASYTRKSTDPVALYIGGSATPTIQYNILQAITPKTLDKVNSSDGDLITEQLVFHWTSSPYSAGGTNQTYIQSITGMGKTLTFNYSQVKYVTSGGTNYYRQFLRSFVDGSANSPINYMFSYYGETQVSPIPGNNYTTILPDSLSTKMDYWGYYAANSNTSLLPKVWVNPSNSSYQRYQIYQSSTGGTNYTYSLTGNNMSVDTANVKTGSLKTVTYAQGGTTTIAYESNDYLDPQTNLVNPGNGIRVKTIKDDAHWNTLPKYRNYSYLNPTTGVSSGKPQSLPAFAFTIPYSGSATGSALWTAATALSISDLSNEDHTIMYEYCRQSVTNGGVTLYQYMVPATNWDASAHPDCSGCSTVDWVPTVDMIARGNCSLTYGPIKNDSYSYPFIPNTNYDFERGLVKKVTNYLDDGTTEVSEANYTYQRSFTPSSIDAFKFDVNSNSSLTTTGYNKYKIYYNTSELTFTIVNSLFNSGTYSQQQNTTSTYTYGSANHKLLTQLDLANSDGSTVSTKISYTKDYTSAGAGTNPNVNAIYNLNQLNINVPVESYQQLTRSGSTKVVGGSLTLFKDFTNSGTPYYLPSQQLKLILPDGLLSTSFTPYVATGSGSSQSSIYNSNYFPVANYTGYDYSGYPMTADDNSHHVMTGVTDHVTFKPALVIKNAAYNEVAFNDFNSAVGIPIFFISGSGGSFTTGDGHTGNSYAFGTAQSATVTVTKNAIAQNYIFSIWIKAATGTNTINISLNGGTAVPYTYTGTGSWKYYEWKIPVSTMPSSFTVAVTSAQAVSIDDLIFYPEIAEVTTFTYDATTYAKNSQTDTNGVSVYYKNDEWGRLLYVLDQDQNIIQRNTIVIPGLY